MPNTADILSPASLTAAVNEVRSPLSFLKNMFFPDEETVPTVHIEMSRISDGRSMAPLVKRNGAGVLVGGDSETFLNFSPAHLRIKRAMEPSELLDRRRAGHGIFQNDAELGRQMREYVARQMSSMSRKIDNREEWLCAQALQGVITYESEEHDSLSVDFGRKASMSYALTGSDVWTHADSNPALEFLAASELINDESEGVATDCVMGAEAAAAFLANAKVQAGHLWREANVRQGQLDLTSTFRDDGAILLGVYNNNTRVWRYNRKVTLEDGSQSELIRSKYAEFIWRSPEAERKVYYGGIRDMKAIGAGKVLRAKRFAKSWEVEDPSARMMLIESNPLPCLRRPNTSVSIQVVA
jgi:hypothetical protein